MSKIFEDLGIYGCSNTDEALILSGILTGEPILFIGEPGSVKTELMYSIFNALRESSKRKNPTNPYSWFNFHIYDTSKINFEDLMGWPNPKELNNGEIKFIPSPTTIWDKNGIGLDELNRCVEERQANILELIRHRTCNGQKTNVKIIFSAINPTGDIGTIQMSDALIDRHVAFIHFTPFRKMSSQDKKRIIEKVGQFDSPGLRNWTSSKFQFDTKDFNEDKSVAINEYLADQGDRITNLINEAASNYDTIKKQYLGPMSGLLEDLVKRLGDSTDKIINSINLSGRRAGMISRTLIAFKAIDIARGNMLKIAPSSITNTAINVILSGIPIGLSTKISADTTTILSKIIKESVTYWETMLLTKSDKETEFIYDIYYNKDPMYRFTKLIQHPNIDSIGVNKLWADLINSDLDLATIFCILKSEDVSSLPEFIYNENLKTTIKDYLRTTVDAEITLNTYLSKWKTQIDDLKKKVANNKMLSCCLSMCLLFANKNTSNDNEALINIKNIEILLDTCKNLTNQDEQASV